MKAFDRFRSLLRAKRPSANELGSAVADARSALETARSELERLRGLRGQMLTAGEGERVAHKRELASYEDAAEDAAAFLEELTSRHSQAQAVEAEAAKRTAYDAAKARVEAAAQHLAQEYPDLGRRWAELLHQVTMADAAAAEVNSALPAGCAPLLGPELLVRDVEQLPRQIVREQIVDRWCYAGEARSLESLGVREDRIQSQGARSGWLPPPIGQSAPPRPVELRSFRRVEVHPPEPRRFGPRLHEMEFPGLRVGDRPFWTPPGHGRPNPGETEINLNRISASAFPARPHAREVRIEWEPARAEGDDGAS